MGSAASTAALQPEAEVTVTLPELQELLKQAQLDWDATRAQSLFAAVSPDGKPVARSALKKTLEALESVIVTAKEKAALEEKELDDKETIKKLKAEVQRLQSMMAAKEEEHKAHSDELKVPEGLREFVAINKTEKVMEHIKAAKPLQDAVAADPSAAAPQEALRKHLDDNLQPAVKAAIEDKYAMEGIVKICDLAVEAGKGFDSFYTSTFNDTIRPAEEDGLKQLASEVGKIGALPPEGCVQPTGDPVELFAAAAATRAKAHAAMEAIATKATEEAAKLEQGPLKAMGRICEKISLRSGGPDGGRYKAERVCDIVRNMFTCASLEGMAKVVGLLAASEAIEIVRVKDRFTTPSASGWRDVMINYKLKGGDGHVCEVQLCHNSLLVARQGLPGHVIYGRVRNALELLECYGLLKTERKARQDALKALVKVEKLSLKQIKSFGWYVPLELTTVGFTRTQLMEAGFSAKEVSGGMSVKLTGHTQPVSAVCSLDKSDETGWKVASGAQDGEIRVWDACTKEGLKVLTGHSGAVNAIVDLGGNKIASCAMDKNVYVWDIESGKPLHTFEHGGLWAQKPAAVNTVVDLGNSLIATCATVCPKDLIMGRVWIWNVETGQQVTKSGNKAFPEPLPILSMCKFGDGFAAAPLSSELGGGTISWWGAGVTDIKQTTADGSAFTYDSHCMSDTSLCDVGGTLAFIHCNGGPRSFAAGWGRLETPNWLDPPECGPWEPGDGKFHYGWPSWLVKDESKDHGIGRVIMFVWASAMCAISDSQVVFADVNDNDGWQAILRVHDIKKDGAAEKAADGPEGPGEVARAHVGGKVLALGHMPKNNLLVYCSVGSNEVVVREVPQTKEEKPKKKVKKKAKPKPEAGAEGAGGEGAGGAEAQ